MPDSDYATVEVSVMVDEGGILCWYRGHVRGGSFEQAVASIMRGGFSTSDDHGPVWYGPRSILKVRPGFVDIDGL